MFKKLFKDLSNDWSSGLLVKFLAFVFAFEFGILGLCLGADLGGVAAAVGALLGLVVAFQWVQSATGNGAPDTTTVKGVEMVAPGTVGMLAGPTGKPDLARWIKFIAFLAGVAIIHVAVIWLRPQLLNAVGVAGAFWALCTSQEVMTKVTGT
jgi:hypothetical protein